MSELLPKYLTVDEFIARLGDEAEQLAGQGLRDNRTVDRDKLAAELVHADGIINGYIRARYPRPFAIVPPELKGIAHDIARYRLRAVGGQQSSQSDAVKDQYDQAIKFLRDIADGRMVLDSNDDGETDAGNANKVVGVMPEARMPDVLEGWR